MNIQLSHLLCVVFINYAASLEFQGADENTIQNLKRQYESLLADMVKLHSDHDKESKLLSSLMGKKTKDLEEAVNRLDNLEKDKALIERWITNLRRRHETIYSEDVMKGGLPQ